MKLRLLFSLAVALLLCTSCRTQHDLAYFEDIATSKEGILKVARNAVRIQPEDELSITVSSEISSATAHFNPTVQEISTDKSAAQVNTTRQLQTYVVDKAGDIDFPTIGKIHVAGMTTADLKNYLYTQVSKTVKNPLIKVKIVNFRVNVLGEVKTPQVVKPEKESINVFEALAACGDLTEYGRRDNIVVLRELENGDMAYGKLDLRDSNITSSPYYYLQQNDVVYVSPNNIRQENSKYNQNNGYKLSLVSTVISGISVIASLVIALTVK